VPALHIYGLLYSVLAPVIASAAISAQGPSFPREIADVVDDSRATVLISVPVHYRAMKETGVFCRGLRLAFSSAGPLDAGDADAFFQQTGTGVFEIYGSTETGGIAARCRAHGEQVLHPFSPVDWKIDSGHLHVRSPFLSPELPTDAQGYFRTADRAAEATGDGFTILGRADGVVKVGGKRVDTEEIRDRIRRFPGVCEAVVMALSTESGRQSILGALVEGDINAAALRRHLVDHLAPYAVPRRIRVVEKIPVTPAGKFDRERVVDLLIG
jgi:acyl-coenzyme A synthetase/AMP-(fatty) acid ligase